MYCHVPFCHSICGYCDFYSQVLDRSASGPLVEALLTELRDWRARIDVQADSIFVGGGTPTTLPPEALRRLLVALRDAAASGREFTVEANPATVTPEIADTLAQAGVNRVSIGAQSFDAGELAVLERLHAPHQVRRTTEVCRSAGLVNLSLDLIFAVPGQTLSSWRRNLDQALELHPEHLSCYGLTYEPGTPLHDRLAAGAVRRADVELEAEMYELAVETLDAAGLHQYEISNFARPGRACRHNLVYWHNEEHLGLGPSACGCVGGLRYRNVPDTAAYVRAVNAGHRPWVEHERLPAERRARETAMLELRLKEGIDRRRFAARFGQDPSAWFTEAIERHERLGLLEQDEAGIRLTQAGLLVADSVAADFL